MSDIDIIACARRASTGCTCDPCKDLNVLAAYVAAVAPLVERLRQVHDYWHGPADEDARADVHRRDAHDVLRDMRRQYRDATDALLAADAAARGGK